MTETQAKTDADPKAVEAAKDVAVQLDKAIRVFRMYDSGNDLVTKFLDELDIRMRRFMDAYGDLSLRVRPTSFEYAGATIAGTGLDEFALALFRQGLTRLSLATTIHRDEVRRFLELLSAGLTGSDSDEDDLVTLLWRADLAGLSYSSVLGYQEADQDDEEKPLAQPDEVKATVVESLMADLEDMAGDTSGALAKKTELLKQEAADLTDEMRQMVSAIEVETSQDLQLYLLEIVGESLLAPVAEENLTNEEVQSLLDLLLRWLVEGKRMENLARFVGFLHFLLDPKSAPDFHFSETVQAFMSEGLTDEQLLQVVKAMPNGPGAAPDAVQSVIWSLARNRKDAVTTLIGDQQREEDRRVLEDVLLAMCGSDPSHLVKCFRESDPSDLVRWLEMIARIGIDHARKAVVGHMKSAAPDAQAAIVSAVAQIPGVYDSRLRENLVPLVNEGGSVRLPVLDLFYRLGDKDAAPAYWRWVRQEDFDTWDAPSKTAVFCGLLALGKEGEGLQHFDEILTRRSLFRRKQLTELQTCVIDALALLGTEGAIGLLNKHRGEGRKHLREPCMAALEQLAARQREERTP